MKEFEVRYKIFIFRYNCLKKKKKGGGFYKDFGGLPIVEVSVCLSRPRTEHVQNAAYRHKRKAFDGLL